MKRAIIIACTFASLILILDSIAIGRVILMFLCAGIIPGTNIELSPTQMIVVIAILTSLVILRIGLSPFLHKFRRLKRA